MRSQVLSSADLPCGRRVQNRLVKVALYEHLATYPGGPPNQYHYGLYSKWAEHDWGIVITGNVQVSQTHLGLGRDTVLPDRVSDSTLEPFKRWAEIMHGGNAKDTLAVMQLSHCGRQSTNLLGGRWPFARPSAPSAVPVGAKNSGWLSKVLHAFFFQTPRPMTVSDIDEVVKSFVKGAQVALLSGFDGIELHAAHGYLLAQFMSPKSNTRTDAYSADQSNALRLLHRVVSSIRAIVPKTFILGIKLNASDYSLRTETTGEERALGHVRSIASWGLVDFIEVSGGDYETPAFLDVVSPRQALFSRFSRLAMQALASNPDPLSSSQIVPQPLILLTGGLRTPALISSVLASNHAHLLGFGRGAILCPDLPSLLRDSPSNIDENISFRPEPSLGLQRWIGKCLPSVPLVGAGVNMAWYVVMMRRLAKRGKGKFEPDYGVGPMGALILMWIWVDDLLAAMSWATTFVVLVGSVAAGFATLRAFTEPLT